MSQEVQGMLIRLEATTAQMRQELARADATVAATSGNIDRRLSTVDGAFNRLGMSAQAMSRMLSGAFAAVSVSALVSQADAYANMASRLKLVTSTAQEFNEAQKAVFEIAQSSYQPLGATAELYQRIATNQKELGLSGKEVAGIVGTISKSMAVSGASAASANAALIQLGQAFASGVLRGEELNSVMEQAPALAQAIAAGMGKTVGELRTLGADGKLTADAVVKALQSQAGAVDALFAKTNTTVGNSLTALSNSTTRFIGELDQATQASAGMAQGILRLSKSIDGGLPQALTLVKENSAALEQVLTTGLYVALGRVAGGFAQQAAQAGYAAIANQKVLAASAAASAQDLNAAKSKQADAKAAVDRANAEVASAQRKVAADREVAISEIARTKAVQASLLAEREREVVRLQAQISDQGRTASLTRLAIVNRDHMAITAQVAAAERALAATTVASSAQIEGAYAARTAAVMAYGQTTAAVNAATAASNRAADAASLTGRAWTGLLAAGGRLVTMMGGPLGLLFITGAVAASFISFRSSTDKVNEGLQNLQGPLDEVIAKFKQLTRDQQQAMVVSAVRQQEQAAIDANKAYGDFLGTAKQVLGSTVGSRVAGELDAARKSAGGFSSTLDDLQKRFHIPEEGMRQLRESAGAVSTLDVQTSQLAGKVTSLREELGKSAVASQASTIATNGMTAAGKKYNDELQKKLGKEQDNNDIVKETNRYIAEHKDLSEADKKAILSTAYAIQAQEKANKDNAKAVRDANKAYQENAGQKMLDDAKQRYAVLLEQKEAIEGQADGSRTLGVEAKKLIQLEQEIAQLKEKKSLTAAQKQVLAMADLNIAQQKQNAELEKANALTKVQLENKAKLVAFQEQLNDQLQLAKEGLDVEVAGIGMGQKQRERLQEDLRIRGDYQKQLAKLQRDYQNIVNPTAEQKDLYDRETQAVKDALAERLRYQSDYYRDLDLAQSNWKNGATAAWQDYIDDASDIAGQTYDVFQSAFSGMEDVLTDFVMTGKLSFNDLANSIIADIARIVVRTKIVTPLLNSMFGGGGGASITGGGAGGSSLDAARSAIDYASTGYSIANSGFGQAVGAGYGSGGIIGGIKAGGSYVGSAVGSFFGGGSAATGTMVNGVYQLAPNAGVATVDLIGNTVTNASGQVVGSASGNTSWLGEGANLGGAFAALGGAVQGWQNAGAKGAVAGAAGGYAGYQAGAMIGSYFGPIGTAVGAAIGAMLGSSFGSKLFGGDWVTKDTGWQLDVTDAKLSSSGYKKQEKKGGLFGKDKKRTRLSPLDEATTKALDDTYDATIDSVYGLFDKLNVTLNDAVLDGMRDFSFQISTQGREADEIQKDLATFFTAVGNEAVFAVSEATKAGLSGFTFEGLQVFVANLYNVNDAIKHLNVGLYETNVQGGFMAEQLSAMAGGFEALTTDIGTYYGAFFSESEKATNMLADVRDQFKDVDLVLPESRDSFRAMVEGIDKSTESGRELFVTLMKLSGAADSAYKILEAQQNTYYTAFFTQAENGVRAFAALNKQLSDANVVLPATRAGFRAMVEAIDTTTDAGRRLKEQMIAQAGAADALYSAQETALNDAVSASFAAVQRAVNAEKSALTAAYNARVASLNDMVSSAQSNISGLTSVTNALGSALKALRGSGDDAVKMMREQAKATLTSALAIARAGGSLSGFEGLEDALGVISDNDTAMYASLEDFNREQGRNANLVAELNGITGKQLTADQQLLRTVQDQIKAAKDQYDDEMARLDGQLELAQAQVDALNGVNNSVLSVKDAMAQLAAAIAAASAAKAPTQPFQGTGAAGAPSFNDINAIYQQVLGRDADVSGAAYWAGQLGAGAVGDLAAAIRADAIKNGELKAYATGGAVYGPGTGTSDSILARLSNGEYVMNADAVRMFGTGLLDQMNAGRVPAFASGGGVGETGPVLQITRPSQIYATQPSQGRSTGQSDAATVAELKALRDEIRAGLAAIATNTKDTSKNTGQLAEVGTQVIGTVQTKAVLA